MIPKFIRDYLGDSYGLLSELAPSRNALVDLYKTYSNPIAFVNWYMRTFPESSRSIAGAVYKVMRFFAKPEQFLDAYGENTPIDRNIIGDIPVPDRDPLLAYQYRYRLGVNVNAPQLGFSQVFNFWLDSPYLLSERDVVDIISPQLIKLVNLYRMTLVEGMPNSATITNTSLVEVVRYNPNAQR